MPNLSPEVQVVVRVGYGLLLMGTLIYTLPHARRFFVTERWCGYVSSSLPDDLLQNPVSLVAIQVLWLSLALTLVCGVGMPWAALANLLICRYFFVHLRWKGVHRGMGAPGFMTYWLGLVVFLLEFTERYLPEQQPLTLLVAQADFAFLYLSSGIYKFKAGYLEGEGMDLGMVNPQWGYWWRSLSKLRPSHPIFTFSNQAAWSLEIVAVILMLLPWTRFWGGLLLILSFLYVAVFIRLGLLAYMVMLTGVLYFDTASIGDSLLKPLGQLLPASAVPQVSYPTWTETSFEAALWVYLVLLPVAYAGLHYNFYFRRRLPGLCQGLLERYTNFFGMIIWRVFSVDLVNFCIRIYEMHSKGRREITRFGWRSKGIRYSHVGESITLTCLFTTLKYYPSKPDLFRERLLRYARTLPVETGGVICFEYLRVVKCADRFELQPAAEFHVDLAREDIEERLLDPNFCPRATAAVSPVHEVAGPGSYAPVGGP